MLLLLLLLFEEGNGPRREGNRLGDISLELSGGGAGEKVCGVVVIVDICVSSSIGGGARSERASPERGMVLLLWC
jgi:hypothetical protein